MASRLLATMLKGFAQNYLLLLFFFSFFYIFYEIGCLDLENRNKTNIETLKTKTISTIDQIYT